MIHPFAASHTTASKQRSPISTPSSNARLLGEYNSDKGITESQLAQVAQGSLRRYIPGLLTEGLDIKRVFRQVRFAWLKETVFITWRRHYRIHRVGEQEHLVRSLSPSLCYFNGMFFVSADLDLKSLTKLIQNQVFSQHRWVELRWNDTPDAHHYQTTYQSFKDCLSHHIPELNHQVIQTNTTSWTHLEESHLNFSRPTSYSLLNTHKNDNSHTTNLLQRAFMILYTELEAQGLQNSLSTPATATNLNLSPQILKPIALFLSLFTHGFISQWL